MPAKPAHAPPSGAQYDYDSGPQTAQRLDTMVRHVVTVPRETVAQREKEWKRARGKLKAKRAKAR